MVRTGMSRASDAHFDADGLLKDDVSVCPQCSRKIWLSGDKCNEGKWKIPCSGLALVKELALNTLKKLHDIADHGDQCLANTPRDPKGNPAAARNRC